LADHDHILQVRAVNPDVFQSFSSASISTSYFLLYSGVARLLVIFLRFAACSRDLDDQREQGNERYSANRAKNTTAIMNTALSRLSPKDIGIASLTNAEPMLYRSAHADFLMIFQHAPPFFDRRRTAVGRLKNAAREIQIHVKS
jgi:hypothetical protein